MFTTTHSNALRYTLPEYDHTQRAPMYWLLLAPALVIAIALMAIPTPTMPTWVVVQLIITGNLLAMLAYSFRWLRIVDDDDRLAVRYGPVPLFRKRIRYADIATAQPSKSTLRDGWGIHWLPGRGWIYNLWGFDCVQLTYKNGRTLRVGTDDPSGLSEFLQRKLGAGR